MSPSHVEEESSAHDVVDTTVGALPVAVSGPQASISVDSEEEDFFSALIPDFDPLVGIGSSLKEPML